MPSISEWWVFEISAKRSSCRPSISHISHRGLERSSCWEKMRAVKLSSCLRSPGTGSAVWRTWYSRLKSGSSTHTGRPLSSAVWGQLVAVARHQVQPPADLLEEFLQRRRRAFQDRQAADVHVRVRPLLVQEGGVDGGQPIEMALGHAH